MMNKRIAHLSVVVSCLLPMHAENISFADNNVKTLCVQNWDIDKDGELSTDEAAAVTTLGAVFRDNNLIDSFEELACFTGLTAIDDYAFNGSSLRKVAFPSSVTYIGENAFCGTKLSGELRVPGTVKNIGNYAFYSCLQLTNIILEEGVETVGYYCFSGPINTLSLASSLSNIGSFAIDPYVNSGASSGVFLPEGDLFVFVHSMTPPVINSFAFYFLNGDGHLVVPYGTKKAYQEATGWKQFREYIEQGDVNTDGSVNHFDVVLLRDYLDGKDVELKNNLLADVNGDGVSDEQDYEELKDRVYIDDGTPTMIAEAETKEQSVPEGVYTIDGRKVLDDVSQLHILRSGIYIVNGKKVVVK